MKVRTDCPTCNTHYVLPSEAIPPEGRRVACRQCGQKWTVPPPRGQAMPSPSQARPAPAPSGGGTPDSVVSCPHCGFHYLASTARPLQGNRPSILLAEDQIFFRDLIREALGESYEYLVASTVEEARAILGSTQLNMMILDLNLEEAGDGEQVLDATPRGTPVLVLTGDQDPDLFGARWEDLQARGATDLLLKGINIRDQLALKVNNILGRPDEV